MAIVTDVTIDIIIDNVKVDEYELSDTLDNYTIEEVQAAAYCGQYNIARRNNCLRTYDYGWLGAFDKDTGVFQYPFKVERVSNTYSWQTGATGYNAPDGLYGGTVWLSAENSTFDSVITDQNASNYRLVTKWNVNKFIFTLPALSGAYGQVSSVTWEQKPYPACYIPEGWGTMTYHTAKGMPYDQTADVSLRPYNIFVFEEKFFLFANKVEAGFIYNSTQEVGNPKVFGDSGHYSYDRSTAIATSYNADYESPIAKSGGGYNQDFGLSTYPTGNRIPFQWQGPGGYEIWYQAAGEDVQNYICFWDHSGYATNGGYIRMSFYFCKVDDVLHYFANMGVYFYADKLYKPIIEDTIVTGYTDDMETVSDIDDWDGSSIHDVPVTPPVPPVPAGDKIDDMNVNPLWAMSSDVGFARYFLMSNDLVGSLKTWLSDTTFPDGYDPYPYIISLIQFPLKLSPDYCMPRTPAGHIVIGGADTGITASLISNEKAWKGLGTYDVPRENGNFLDYSPYSQYEVYIPCCGWVTCPDIIAGRKIAVKVNYDLTTAAIIGNVYVTIDGKEMIVASKSGMMGRETIVSGDAAGVRSAQITSALLSAGTGALNVATGAMSGNAVAAVSGGYHVVAGLAQANIAANSSYARTVGSTGGRALLCQYDKCYLKICTTEADIPAGYGHTIGYICNKSGKVSDFRGYTVFDNFDVTGITGLTQRELMEIKRLMESGVYINSPPE